MNWQPIETAPKDGRYILIWVGALEEYDLSKCLIAYWEFEGWQAMGLMNGPWSSYEPQPSHWAEIEEPE